MHLPIRKKSKGNSIKQQIRQKQKLAILVASGSIILSVLILIIYINLTKSDEMKARESYSSEQASVPVELNVPALVEQAQQPEWRGMQYKQLRTELNFENVQP